MPRNLDHLVRDAQPAIVLVACIALASTHSFEIVGGLFAALQIAALATWGAHRLMKRSTRRFEHLA